MKNFSFSFLSFSELYSFTKVLSQYKPKHIFDKNRKYFNWRFKSSSKKYSIAILKYKKEIISFLSFYSLSQYDKSLDKKIIFLSLAFNKKNIVPAQLKLLINFIIKKKIQK